MRRWRRWGGGGRGGSDGAGFAKQAQWSLQAGGGFGDLEVKVRETYAILVPLTPRPLRRDCRGRGIRWRLLRTSASRIGFSAGRRRRRLRDEAGRRRTAPSMGATQNSQSWPIAQPPHEECRAAVLRAGFTDVLVTGISIR